MFFCSYSCNYFHIYSQRLAKSNDGVVMGCVFFAIAAQWPSFLCVCSVFYSGTVQLYWRQWPGTTPKWFTTKKGVLGAGPSGVFTGDITVSDGGALLFAGVPVANPSTVVVWEVIPWGLNSPGSTQQVTVKPTVGMHFPLLASPPSWLGFAPLAAYLLSWQEQVSEETKLDGEDSVGPLLQCSVVSNLSAYVCPEASASIGWGSGVVTTAFDPSSGGTALITVIVEGESFEFSLCSLHLL
jgi:hypothetical protein